MTSASEGIKREERDGLMDKRDIQAERGRDGLERQTDIQRERETD